MKWFYKTFISPFTKEGFNKQMQLIKEHNCSHEEWTCDTQIRVIQCNKCGKRAWIKEYKDLY